MDQNIGNDDRNIILCSLTYFTRTLKASVIIKSLHKIQNFSICSKTYGAHIHLENDHKVEVFNKVSRTTSILTLGSFTVHLYNKKSTQTVQSEIMSVLLEIRMAILLNVSRVLQHFCNKLTFKPYYLVKISIRTKFVIIWIFRCEFKFKLKLI